MTTSTAQDRSSSPSRAPACGWRTESLGLLALLALAAYFLAVSWRKWVDPITDSGLQWYAAWRLAHGATLYHDIFWNYGPLSTFFNATLFKCFSAGMMNLVTANLLIYALIAALAYVAFRRAWGCAGAFAALAVFISVFSFSRLNAVANYNYATPYAHESTHGMLLILAAAFVAVRWCREPSRLFAFLLGLCGGLATVLKPEFMLAGGVLGLAACAIRWLQKQPPRAPELLLILAGLALPTLAFTLWFARTESLPSALVDASQAWWLVLVDRTQGGSLQQQAFLGLNRPGSFAMMEIYASLWAIILICMACFFGRRVNRFQARGLKLAVTLMAISIGALSAGVALVFYLRAENGWPFVNSVGGCLPVLILLIFAMMCCRLWREIRQTGRATETTLMAFALVLLSLAMLARMPLRARITQFGFYQAALAGMVVTAFVIAEVPRWTGSGAWGRRLTTSGCALIVAVPCLIIAARSHQALADQTQPVATGGDRFYASDPAVDETGSLVDWTVEHLRSLRPQATVTVLPEGAMINYLSRHISPVSVGRGEAQLLAQLQKTPPDYVIIISRDLSESGITRYGAPGGPGYAIVQWLQQGYAVEGGHGGDPLGAGDRKGVLILRHNASAPPPPK